MENYTAISSDLLLVLAHIMLVQLVKFLQMCIVTVGRGHLYIMKLSGGPFARRAWNNIMDSVDSCPGIFCQAVVNWLWILRRLPTSSKGSLITEESGQKFQVSAFKEASRSNESWTHQVTQLQTEHYESGRCRQNFFGLPSQVLFSGHTCLTVSF